MIADHGRKPETRTVSRAGDWPKAVRELAAWLDQPGVPAPGSDWQARPPAEFPPPQANAWGRDVYGLWYEFAVAEVVQRMRWIVPGQFLMGSPESEAERDDDEISHQVTLSEGFWLADTPCTQALWLAVMEKNPSRFENDPQNPVEQISWDDTLEFCQQLNHSGTDFYLPSEAQWEYACRASTQSVFWWGDELSVEQANYREDSPYNGAAKGEDRNQTLPVKIFAPNPWGLYQMHGNVKEWCADWYEPYSGEDQHYPQGPKTGEQRVLRGGSWIDRGREIRSAYRDRFWPGIRFGNGASFRLSHPETKKEKK